MDAYDRESGESEMLPNIERLRESQRTGTSGRGLPENSTGRLNEAQAHAVEIVED